MSTAQALLPLPVSGLPGAARRPRLAPPIQRKTARNVLRPAADGPYAWSLDPYRRGRTAPGAVIRSWAAFGAGTGTGVGTASARPLIALDGASEALLSTLSAEDVQQSLAGQPIALGAGLDPYPAVEESLGVTRSLLETLTAATGLDLHLTTRSPLVLRDLDLLVALDRSHTVTLDVPVPTLGAELARRLEPPVAGSSASGPVHPEKRLEVLAAIAAQGITTRLVCLPVAPELNDSAEELEPLIAAAREAGAVDVAAHCLELRGSFRGRFFEWLGEDRPKLAARYRKLYGRRGSLRRADKNRTLREFRRLRLAYGFPSARPGRG